MASVNKVILLGNVGRDPETRYTSNGTAVCTISLATSSRRKDKSSGETVEDTQWHRVTFYDRLAEVVAEYVKKGRQVYVEGRLKYGKYTDKDGVDKYTTDIIAVELQLMGDRQNEERGGGGGARRQEPGRGGQQERRQPQRGSSGSDDMDDDIPF